MWKAIIAMFIGTIFISIGDGLLSKGLRDFPKLESTGTILTNCFAYICMAVKNPLIVLGVVCHAIFFGLMLLAFSLGDVSLVLPITALSYIFVAIIAKIYLNENVNSLRWIGSVIIVLGVIIVLLGQRKDDQLQKLVKHDEPYKKSSAVD